MKRTTSYLFIFILFTQNVFTQEKEWLALIDVLDKEMKHFIGKSGFIRLSNEIYTNFEIKKGLVDNDSIFSSLHYYNRFSTDKIDVLIEESYDTSLFREQSFLCGLNILYGYSNYFPNFPDSVYIELLICEDMPTLRKRHKYQDRYNTKTETIDSRGVIMPVRMKNLDKIIKKLNQYIEETLWLELKSDILH